MSRVRKVTTVLGILICASASLPGGAVAQVAQEVVRPWAWSENLGWIHASPTSEVGLRTTRTDVSGGMWAENAGWINLSPARIEDNGPTAGSTPLTGFAWGENVGWISFDCANTGSCDDVDYQVYIERGTGELLGWAWAENAGWISFNCRNDDSCDAVDYAVQIGPCPDITSIDVAWAPTGVNDGGRVVGTATITVDGSNFVQAQITHVTADQGPTPAETSLSDTQFQLLYPCPVTDPNSSRCLPDGGHFVHIQHPNGCRAVPERFVAEVVVSPSSSTTRSESCGLLGVEALVVLAAAGRLRRQRSVC